MRRAAALGGLIVAVGGIAWWAIERNPAPSATAAAAQTRAPAASMPVPTASASDSSVVVDASADDAPVDAGLTPMAQRVAVIGLLNKRNGVSRDLTLKPGQAVRVGDVVVRLRACERTAPWEPQTLTGAFVQLDVQNVDHKWGRVFSGWLYKERPQLNVVLHPIYDVWTKSCAMTFPGVAPEAAPTKASNAKKSPAASAPDAADETPDTSDSASDNSAI